MPVPADYLARHAATPGAHNAVAYWRDESRAYAPGFHIGSEGVNGEHRRAATGWPFSIYRRSIAVGGVDVCICTGIQSLADARVIRDLLNGAPEAPEGDQWERAATGAGWTKSARTPGAFVDSDGNTESFASWRALCEAEGIDPAAPILVNLYSDPEGAPYATGVDLAEAYPEESDRAEALRQLAANPGGFWEGGGAAPAIYIRPA